MRNKRRPVEIGDIYERLTVTSRGEDWVSPGFGYHKPQYVCKCDCGKIKLIAGSSLQSGLTKSCGCIQKERASQSNKSRQIHGHSPSVGRKQSGEYGSWQGMFKRCENPSDINYHNYGGRGISVCERWRTFANFLEDMGLKGSPDLSIDRIDVNGNYEPSNCRWATHAQQTENRRPHIRPRNSKGQFTSEVIYL